MTRELDRRKFLKKTGGALAAGALSGLYPGAGQPVAAKQMIRGGGVDHAGMFWFYPGFFEWATGPWQSNMPPNPKVVDLWKSAIDWFADHGLNFAVIQLGPWAGDANPGPLGADKIRFGWGYHYVLNFDRYPEARCFAGDFVLRCQDIVREITDYGAQKGVDIYTHHYNFMAPKNFIQAHPDTYRLEYLRRGNWVDWDYPVWDLRQNLCYDVCWMKPTYQNFLVSCIEEYFQLFPSAAGIMVTPGERARCQCVDCIGERSNDADARAGRYQNSPEKYNMITNFCQTFKDTLDRVGKKALIRSWIAPMVHLAPQEWARRLPKGITYVTKYSLLDLMDSGADPLIDHFLDEGHDMWFMKEITGSENAGPMVMAVPEAYGRFAEECARLGVKGIMGVDNVEHGYQFRVHRVQHSDLTLFANTFGMQAGTAQQAAEQYYANIFGDKGAAILAAVNKCSQTPFTMPRLVHSHGEGYTWRFAYRFISTGWPGTIGRNLDAPEWAAREIVPLERYVEYLAANPWESDFRETVTSDGEDAIHVLENLTSLAAQGLQDLQGLAPDVLGEAREELDLLINSANLAYWTGRKWLSFFTARISYSGAMGTAAEPQRKLLAGRTVVEYTRALTAMRMQLRFLEELPTTIIDPNIVVGNQETDIRLREEELAVVQGNLGDLLEGSTAASGTWRHYGPHRTGNRKVH